MSADYEERARTYLSRMDFHAPSEFKVKTLAALLREVAEEAQSVPSVQALMDKAQREGWRRACERCAEKSGKHGGAALELLTKDLLRLADNYEPEEPK